jgi:hypothetical protein
MVYILKQDTEHFSIDMIYARNSVEFTLPETKYRVNMATSMQITDRPL